MLNSQIKRTASCLVILAMFSASTLNLSAQQPAQAIQATAQGTTADGMRDGELLAEQKKTGGNLAGGLAVGALTGLVGAGIGYFVIGPESFTPEAMQMNQGKSSDYQLGFRTSWEKKTKEKKRNAFIAGGLLGTIAFVALYVAATGSNSSK